MQSLTMNTSNRKTVSVKNICVEEDRQHIFSLEQLMFLEGDSKKWHSSKKLMCKIVWEHLQGIEEQ